MAWRFDGDLKRWVNDTEGADQGQELINPESSAPSSVNQRKSLRENSDDLSKNDLSKIDMIMSEDNSDYELETGSNHFPTLQSVSDAYTSGELKKAFHTPHQGALLLTIKKNPKKLDMMQLAMQALSVYKGKEGSIAGYIIGRFFLSNADARSFAEAVKVIANDSDVEDVLVAFKLFGLSVNDRADIDKVMLDLYSAHPWIKGLIS